MENFIQQEELVRKYLDEGNKEAAMELLLELVTARAKEKDFKAAEALRDRIFEIDPLALSVIISSGEIIEEEKYKAIDKGHRRIWAELYKDLSMEEANAFYFALNNAAYGPDETIYRQGESSRRLHFVNGGRLKVVYLQNGNEVLVKALSAGQIAGEETFFSHSLCTTSLITLSPVELSYLRAEELKNWQTDFPMLESKLRDIAAKSESITNLLKAKGLNRRLLKRVNVTGKGVAQLRSGARAPVGKPFRVEMSDISQGGICFYVRMPKRETASLLLEKKMSISCPHPQMDSSNAVNREGTIVAVRFHLMEDCSVHVRFDGLLEKKVIEEFARGGYA